MAELDLSLLKNISRKGINLPDSEIQKAIQTVKKKEAQEKQLEKKVQRLDKVINHTDKLIAKSKQSSNKDESKTLSNHNPIINKSDTNHYQKQCKAEIHYSDYLMLKKRGFFLKVHWSNNGMRVFHLDPKIYQ